MITQFILHSPFVGHLGMQLREIEDDRALLALPFTEQVVTIGDGSGDGKLVATGLVTYKLG